MEKKIYLIQLKEIVKLSLISAALFITSAVFCQAPTNGLKLYYDFEAVSGGSVPDVSGNGAVGTFVGGAVVAPGKTGSGVNFPTVVTPAADYIQLPNGITGSLTDFTVAAWVKMDATKDWMRVFDFGAGTDHYMFLSGNVSSVRFAFKNATGGSEEGISSTNPLPVGKWAHVAITCSYTGGVGTGKLYINGSVVGTNNAITITPAALDVALGVPTSQNYIAKSQWNDPGFNGTIDEFRIYNRAASNAEILQMMGVPSELVTQYFALNLGDLSAVKSNLTLPATMGTNGVTVKWASANPGTIATNGTITRPETYDVIVTLTATLKLNTDTLVKTFTATVAALHPPSETLAKWNFANANISVVNDTIVKVKDESGSNFVGTLKNVAKIRTIGKTVKYNVLDLGNKDGYFDMDTVIGKAIYSLSNYAVGAYFRIDPKYTELNNNGNFLWNFSNMENVSDAAADKMGYLIGILKSQNVKITPNRWEGEQGPGVGANAPKGGWHHFAYSQNGTTGTIYLDGIAVKTATVTQIPANTLVKPGKTGTNYNWLGRSCYTKNYGDVYLRQTLVYGFELYKVNITQDDWQNSLDVPTVIAALNNAYAEDSVGIPTELITEMDHLTTSIGDLSAIHNNLTLPTAGTLDNSILIKWTSSRSEALTNTGVITPNDYVNTYVILTATMYKGAQKLSKDFTVAISPKSGTQYSSDLLLNYNFATSQVSGTAVTDAAEKHFTGTLKKGATAVTIGPADNKHNILYLGTDSAYFDMGTECGKLSYGLTDYSVSLYFLVDKNKTNFANDGNFLYTFSNSDSSGTVRNGYMFGRASNVIQCVSSSYWSTGNMATSGVSQPSQGAFHHFLYTQKDLVGTVYFDGKVVSTNTAFTNLPSIALPKAGRTGTLYNFLGRSCYVGDKYLSKAMLADFQLYKKALTNADVDAMQVETRNLNLAYVHDSVPSLITEMNNLDLGNVSAVVSDLSLPVNGTLDPLVAISWASNKTFVINANGVVTRPDFLNAKVILTATLMKDGATLTKQFIVTVKANPGTEYASDLLLNYNFADNLVSGAKVTDAAEKHFTGTLMENARVSTIGPAGNLHNVLNLSAETAYFDMGVDCGKLIYLLDSAYSISVYFLIDPNKTNFSAKGNFLYTFSNSDSSNLHKTGYMFGRANNAVSAVSSQDTVTGNMQTAPAKTEPSKGVFHYFVYTQNRSVGTTYLDGDTVSSVTSFTNIPSIVIPKDGLFGTLYNWLGRSNYPGHAFLSNAMIADFKLQKKVLSNSEVKAMKSTASSLSSAYLGATPVEVVKAADKCRLDVSVPGLLQIIPAGNEKVKVTVYDPLGRIVAQTDSRAVNLNSGIYIVSVNNNQVEKVWIK